MDCRFRGHFSDNEKERLERAAARYEKTRDDDSPAWAFVHFKTPYKGSSFWGVRADDGYMVKARTAPKLAEAVDTARKDRIERRRIMPRPTRRASSRPMSSSRA